MKTFNVELTEEELVLLIRITNELGASNSRAAFLAIKGNCIAGYGYSNITELAHRILGETYTIWNKFRIVAYNNGIDTLHYKPVVPFEPVSVKLNDDYTAEVQKDGSVKVGCQTFSKDALETLLKVSRNVTA